MSNYKICSVEDCTSKHVSKGFCKKHYGHNRRYGHPTQKPTKLPKLRKRCTVETCEGYAYRSTPYCRPHHYRWQKYGNPEHSPLNGKNRSCEIDGCTNQYFAKGLCRTHYRRVRANGSPDREIRNYGESFTCLRCKIWKSPENFSRPTARICARCHADYQSEWRKGSESYQEKSKRAWAIRVYGPDAEPLHDARLNGAPCEVCGGTKNLVIDHNHTTGQVRGLLCQGCNLALGAANENPDTLLGLVSYLLVHDGENILESSTLETGG